MVTTKYRQGPDFIGIGPPKTGTSWLDAVLRQHQEICLPRDRKEVFFFDTHYERGYDWYHDLFAHAGSGQAIGEITSTYMPKKFALERIADYNNDIKIVVILRDPVDRMISHFRMKVENGAQDTNISEAINNYTSLYAYSNYAGALPVLFDLFDHSKIYIIIYEEMFADAETRLRHLQDLARFLDVDPHSMACCDITDKVRETRGPPRNLLFYRLACRLRARLRRHDMEWVIAFAKRLGLRRDHLLSRTMSERTRISPQTRAELETMMAADKQAAEYYLGRQIPVWRE